MIIVNTDTLPEDVKYPPVPEKPPRNESQSSQDESQGERSLPPPPPYSQQPAARPVPTGSSPNVNLPGSSSVFQPVNPQTVNHFELFSRHGVISGTYLIDPRLPSPMADRKMCIKRKQDRVWGKGPKEEINAMFHTRHGALNLDLAVIAARNEPAYETVPAHVFVSSRHGRVFVNLHEVQAGRSLDLQVETRHGKIVVLLPPTFNGPVVFQSRNHKAVNFLPAFAQRARTLRASDRETIVLCAPPDIPPRSFPVPSSDKHALAQLAEGHNDRCLVRTRSGKIVIGISGLDVEEEPRAGRGLFETLGRFLEFQGRAVGQYVEERTRVLERTLTERSEVLAQYMDGQMDKAQSKRTGCRAGERTSR